MVRGCGHRPSSTLRAASPIMSPSATFAPARHPDARDGLEAAWGPGSLTPWRASLAHLAGPSLGSPARPSLWFGHLGWGLSVAAALEPEAPTIGCTSASSGERGLFARERWHRKRRDTLCAWTSTPYEYRLTERHARLQGAKGASLDKEGTV